MATTSAGALTELQLENRLDELYSENVDLHHVCVSHESHEDIRVDIKLLRRRINEVALEIRQFVGNQVHPRGVPLFPLQSWDAGAAEHLENYHRRVAAEEVVLQKRAERLAWQETDMLLGMGEARERLTELDMQRTAQLQFREMLNEELRTIQDHMNSIFALETSLVAEHNDLVDNFDSVVTDHIDSRMQGKEAQIKGGQHGPVVRFREDMGGAGTSYIQSPCGARGKNTLRPMLSH